MFLEYVCLTKRGTACRAILAVDPQGGRLSDAVVAEMSSSRLASDEAGFGEYLKRIPSVKRRMTVTVRIRRSDGHWVATVPKAKELLASSPSLKRLRGHVEGALEHFFPKLAKLPRREIIDLPRETRVMLKGLAKAEQDAARAKKRAASLRRQTSRKLRARLGISIREVGDLMGISGARAQQLLE